MRESQIKEIKALYSSKYKNKIQNNSADEKMMPNIVSKPFFNSVMEKLNSQLQR